jgi:hypothetical protein
MWFGVKGDGTLALGEKGWLRLFIKYDMYLGRCLLLSWYIILGNTVDLFLFLRNIFPAVLRYC